MLQWANTICVLVALWGMIGIWTTKVGYHNVWEFWLYAAIYGFGFGAQFSYGQAFMAELVPKGREYMFFSLLGIVSKGSAWIGPIVSSAIVDRTGNQWTVGHIRRTQIHELIIMLGFSLGSCFDLCPLHRDILYQRGQESEGVRRVPCQRSHWLEKRVSIAGVSPKH